MAQSVPILRRKRHESWLLELTSLPTAAGREQAVMRWLDRFLAARKSRLVVKRDDMGNYLVSQRGTRPRMIVTAHLDHPAFVVIDCSDLKSRELVLEFRGGVHNPYFTAAKLRVIDSEGGTHLARITSLDADALPYKRVRAKLVRAGRGIGAGDIARWDLPGARIVQLKRGEPRPTRTDARRSIRILETHACDDLAAVAAACALLDELLRGKRGKHVGLLFTVAEEVGFVGAIHAAQCGFVPRSAQLICLENSRSFPSDSPIGAGAILRVGDRMSVFSPILTNALSELYGRHAKANPGFKYQRKLMAGGACEATAFSSFGFQSTCLCLPLGNYHNMRDIDRVLAGHRPALVGPEYIAVDDFHSMVEMLLLAALQGGRNWIGSTRKLMAGLHAKGRRALSPTRIQAR